MKVLARKKSNLSKKRIYINAFKNVILEIFYISFFQVIPIGIIMK